MVDYERFKGAGRGALLYSEKHVTDAATGELLAVTTSTTFRANDCRQVRLEPRGTR